ncbi:hypothetical protein LCGC14_0959480 [marine sediment metagenome]|uniref:Uncharacterized protein n=1 Tax=marine sediment metagenome TaxID=412755 RepID=A0A0F9NET3_9ZZZZ
MSKPKQNIDDYTVGNFYPEALLVFVSIDENGDPIRNLASAFTTIPDISDITDVQLSLGSTGKLGQFTVRINNANNKYFVADDMEMEITNLKKGTVGTFTSSVDANRIVIEEAEAATTWENVQDFLNNEVFPRVYPDPPEGDDGQTYIVYQDGDEYIYNIISNDSAAAESQDPPVQGENPPPAEEEVTEELTEKQKQDRIVAANRKRFQTERLNLKKVPLSIEEVAELKKKTKHQSAFFEEYGGQLENGRCVFVPMQLMVCLLTRRFKDKNDPEDMIVAFTGFIDSVSEEYDGKASMLRIQGTDVSKLMHITQANVNPSLFQRALPGGGQYKIWSNIFSGQQGWQIIKTLIIGGEDTEGQAIHGAGHFVYNAKYSPDSSTDGKTVEKRAILTGLKFQAAQWDKDGNVIIANDKLDKLFFRPGRVHIQILPFEVSPKGLRDLSVYKKIFGASFQNWQNEYRSHLEIANEVAQLSNYEFYADQFGDIWYHQPRFHNYHILTNDNPEVYIIRDEDIITYQFTESDKDVVSTIYVAGQPNYSEVPPQIMKMTGFYEDSSLLRKYGRRMMSLSHPYITDTSDCFYFAKSWMLRVNAGRFVGTITMLGRPELRMHMPVYIPMRNMIYYIIGISHKFVYGQTFTTTLQLKYGHKPWEILPEILDYGIPDKISSENPSTDSEGTASAQGDKTLALGENVPVTPEPSPPRESTNTPIQNTENFTGYGIANPGVTYPDIPGRSN